LSQWTRNDQFDRREEFNERVASHLLNKPTEVWMQILERHQIWFAPVSHYEEVEQDPQVQWNRSVMSFDHPRAGKVRVLAHPIRYDGEPPPLRSLPPALGEQSIEILRDLGYDEASIEALIKAGTIGVGTVETPR
ncbi:MAG: CoA transferase, partial [Betaproteobacteria bacterium]